MESNLMPWLIGSLPVFPNYSRVGFAISFRHQRNCHALCPHCICASGRSGFRRSNGREFVFFAGGPHSLFIGRRCIGGPVAFLRVLVRDESAPIVQLREFAQRISIALMNAAGTDENGLHAYFRIQKRFRAGSPSRSRLGLADGISRSTP